MEFSFNVEFANRYGIDEAIMIKSFQFWIRLNKANGNNFNDGKYWTYNTNKSLTLYFSFWSEKQVRRIIESLVDKGILLKGNYNKIGMTELFGMPLLMKTYTYQTIFICQIMD
jgi:hypothetical protein